MCLLAWRRETVDVDGDDAGNRLSDSPPILVYSDYYLVTITANTGGHVSM